MEEKPEDPILVPTFHLNQEGGKTLSELFAETEELRQRLCDNLVQGEKDAWQEEIDALCEESTSESSDDYQPMTWNHRILKHEHPEGDWFAVHEVHYEGDNPVSCTTEPIAVTGSNMNEMKWTLDKMREACDKPILEYKFFTDKEKESNDGD